MEKDPRNKIVLIVWNDPCAHADHIEREGVCPGGDTYLGENERMAAFRICVEETGLTPVLLRPLHTGQHSPAGAMRPTTYHVFVAMVRVSLDLASGNRVGDPGWKVTSVLTAEKQPATLNDAIRETLATFEDSF